MAQGYKGSTPYGRWGNWPFIVFCFGALGFLVFRILNERKQKRNF
jgi:apolipoprotein N-acyltransferase